MKRKCEKKSDTTEIGEKTSKQDVNREQIINVTNGKKRYQGMKNKLEEKSRRRRRRRSKELLYFNLTCWMLNVECRMLNYKLKLYIHFGIRSVIHYLYYVCCPHYSTKWVHVALMFVIFIPTFCFILNPKSKSLSQKYISIVSLLFLLWMRCLFIRKKKCLLL